MKALTWHGKRDVRVDDVPDPTIEEPTDAIIRVTSTGLCGSDLHLYEVLGPFIDAGRRPRPRADGHRRGGRRRGRPTSRSATASSCPFNISCGHCFMCEHGLQSQCETTQVREQGMGAALFGYTKLYGQVPGGQAEFLRVPAGPLRADQGARGPARRPLPLPLRRPAHRLAGGRSTPTIPDGGSVAVLGLGPIGEMAARIAQHLGAGTVIGVDLVPERLARARRARRADARRQRRRRRRRRPCAS